jgi:uncharacterized cupredoxin-like copper-binding protein
MQKIHDRTGRALVTASAVLMLLPACTTDPSTATGHVLDVTVKDFRIKPALPAVGEGPVTFSVWNAGPSTHEFVVVRSDRSADELPIAADGLSVDEDGVVPIDELTEVDSGTRATLTLALSPGRYVIFCNLEGHYLGGMHAALEVTHDA